MADAQLRYQVRKWFDNRNYKRYLQKSAMKKLNSSEVVRMIASPGHGFDSLDGLDSRRIEEIVAMVPARNNVTNDNFAREAMRAAKSVSPNADYLARGAYGIAFVIPAASLGPRFNDVAKRSGIDVSIAPASIPPQSGVAVMKVAKVNGASPRAISDELLELRKHAYLAKRSVQGTAEGVPNSAAYVPKFYGGGYTGRINATITFMEYLPGKKIGDLATLSRADFDALQSAFVSMWARRLFHADAHGYNLLLTEAGPKIIDFGQSIVLPERLRARSVQSALTPEYFKELDDYAAMYSYKEGYSFQNPNTRSLRFLYEKLPKEARPAFRTFVPQPLPPRNPVPAAKKNLGGLAAMSANSSPEDGEIVMSWKIHKRDEKKKTVKPASRKPTAPKPPSKSMPKSTPKLSTKKPSAPKPRSASLSPSTSSASARTVTVPRPKSTKRGTTEKKIPAAITWNQPSAILRAAPVERLKKIARAMRTDGFTIAPYYKNSQTQLASKIIEARKKAPNFSSKKTVAQLKAIARKEGVRGAYAMTRNELVREIKARRG
jgi:hypothetical protein